MSWITSLFFVPRLSDEQGRQGCATHVRRSAPEVAVLPGHKSARNQARDRLEDLAVTRGDGTTERNYVRAVAELGFPEADRALAARVIARAIGRSPRSLDRSRDMDENG